MPIEFKCRCGEALEVDDQYAGSQVQCPYCQKLVTAPSAKPTPAAATRPKQPVRPRLADEEDDERPTSRSRRTYGDEEDDRPSRRRKYDDEDEDDDRPRRRKRDREGEPRDPAMRALMDSARAESRRERRRHREERSSATSGAMIGGLLTMLISGSLFVVLLFLGIIWFWMPILFVMGLIAFIRGLMTTLGGSD